MKWIPTCTHTGLLALTGSTGAQECIRACTLAALCVFGIPCVSKRVAGGPSWFNSLPCLLSYEFVSHLIWMMI